MSDGRRGTAAFLSGPQLLRNDSPSIGCNQGKITRIMRIISIRVEPVARIFAGAYAFFGLLAFFLYAVAKTGSLTLPFGVLAPLVQLSLNLHLGGSNGVAYNIFLCIAAVFSYAFSGWVTGLALALCFNLIAKQAGGIDAKYVIATVEDAPAKSTL